jgi:hypothetical protein
VDIVVLAGGKTPSDVRDATGVSLRSLLPFGEGTILDRVLHALREAVGGDLDEVIVVGVEVPTARTVPAGDSLPESLANGVAACRSDLVLVSAADLPFLSPESVRAFLSLADKSKDMNYPIIPLRVCKEAFPSMRRTSLKTREGRFTGGNLFLVRRGAFERLMPKLVAAYANRKSPLRLASQVGFGVLARVVLGQFVPATLPVGYLERAVGRVLDLSVKAVQIATADIGADVDSMVQYQQALEYLSQGTV